MVASVAGIHHVTAIGGEPVAVVDFYTRVLGLRLVKRTVNYDDPGTWHLYFGDRAGRPGTLVTFFPHPGARAGRGGSSEVSRTAWVVPQGSLGWWRRRLEGERLGVHEGEQASRPALLFRDFQGTLLALVEGEGLAEVEPWAGTGVPEGMAVRGLAGACLSVSEVELTSEFMGQVLGLPEAGRGPHGRWFDAGAGQWVEVVGSAAPRSQFGAGSVHHVALRSVDDETQLMMRHRLMEAGVSVTPVNDRRYFRSIYFREPGGVILECATDGPGFAIDEPEAELGGALQLPPWLEGRRAAIERTLPPLSGDVL